MALLAGILYGSDGLEPATSGVTGLFHEHDDWRRLTRYRSIHAVQRAFRTDLCTIAQSRLRAFAALLLPKTLRFEPAARDVGDHASTVLGD